ncbi:MAG: hypothetical protein ACOYK8_08790 [Alphaproteobacteria bacterium]
MSPSSPTPIKSQEELIAPLARNILICHQRIVNTMAAGGGILPANCQAAMNTAAYPNNDTNDAFDGLVGARMTAENGSVGLGGDFFYGCTTLVDGSSAVITVYPPTNNRLSPSAVMKTLQEKGYTPLTMGLVSEVAGVRQLRGGRIRLNAVVNFNAPALTLPIGTPVGSLVLYTAVPTCS